MSTRFLQVFLMLMMGFSAMAQVTNSSMTGKVTDEKGEPLIGAGIEAIHVPSGTYYGSTTSNSGSFTIPGMRVGGPYKVTVSYVGYQSYVEEGVSLSLGVSYVVNAKLKESSQNLDELIIIGTKDPILNSSRTGAATSVNKKSIESMPTISRRINDFTRLTPQSSGNSFAGQDNRLNNITVDGSSFNNSFGLAGQPGDRTGVSPISLDAIDQIQVNIAPYDVTQGNFVGAGVNTVTRSGTNDFEGSVYYFLRNENMVGRKAGDFDFAQGKFGYDQIGARIGGPLIKDKLFFFASYEQEKTTEPGTTFRANRGGETVAGNVTRVQEADLNQLSTFLQEKFGYATGPYQGYDNSTNANKFLVRLDYNLNKKNKLSLRYTHLDSDTDVLLSNSSSLGFGNRRTNLNGLNFQNSNYQIVENIRSVIGEWNYMINNTMSNNLIVGYTFQDESRKSRGSLFPMVDILRENTVYTTFGFEPFTPNNELRYSTWQLQNNLNIYKDNHTFTLGVSLERYESENIFFPGSQSVYVYNSLDDFYTDANDYLANPNRTVSPVTLNRFEVRWNNIPGQDVPVQPLKVVYPSLYAQDKWTVNDQLTLTYGVRFEAPFFQNTALRNAAVEDLIFRNELGDTVRYSTDRLPKANILFSPRLGFNYDVFGNRTTQIRGGTGIFTGRPAYVWISNQVGNNGILTGFERLTSTTARPFHPDVDHYKPTEVTGEPASRYELALTERNYRFPQIWRTNLAIDQKLPFGFTGTVEAIYNRDVNGIYYINANLSTPNDTFVGVDNRPRWTSTNDSRINANIDNAIVLKNQNVGESYNIAVSIEKPFLNSFFFKAGYSYGVTRNTVDPGSVAFGSWNGTPQVGDPNNPGLAFGTNTLGHRYFGALSYRAEHKNGGSTTLSLFFDSFTQGIGSYRFSGDANNDGGNANDLIYIPRDRSEMNFTQYTASGVTFTKEMQEEAFEKLINSSDYLSKNRGRYAERGGAWLPMVGRLDLSVVHDFAIKVGSKKNFLQVRMDFLNFTNMLNPQWGVGEGFTTLNPLTNPTRDAEGKLAYRLQQFNGVLVSEALQSTVNPADVFRIQLGVRYTFSM